MSNRGLIITLIILLSIIILGLVMFLVAALTGNLHMDSISIGQKSNMVIFDETYKIDNIKDIEVLSNAGDITFKESEDDRIRVVAYGNKNNEIEVLLNDDKLSIDYSKFKRGFALFSFNIKSNDIIIYIPESYSEEIKIENDYGNCKICDLENATIKAKVDCGNVEIGKVKNAEIKCDLGNIEIGELSNKCELEVDCGNAKIDKTEIKENSTIKCNLGNVEIKEINDIYVDADVDLGKAKIGVNNRNSDIILKVNVDCGDAKIAQ